MPAKAARHTLHRLPRRPFLVMLWVIAGLSGPVLAADTKHLIEWQAHNAEAFQKARAENKFLLLNLEAVWCHWCHVMEARTYSNPQVASLIEQHYVPVKADHDARPDLAERYRDYGWPATIVLSADGTEIIKRAGYIAPENMQSLLQAIVDDPSPEAGQLALPDTFSRSPLLTKALATALQQRHINTYDITEAGLDIAQKFLDADAIEWALKLSDEGNKEERRRARQTLDAAIKLIDPAFGGAYQYSTHGDQRHLQAAIEAANWIIKHRAYVGGGFRHAKVDSAGPYLPDTLHMGRAFLALHEATGDEGWLKRADRAARFMHKYFKHDAAGLVSAVDNGTPVTPLPQLDQNIAASRLLTALAEYPLLHLSRERNLSLSAHTLRMLVTEEIALSRLTDPGILMAEKAYREAAKTQ